MVKQTYHGNAQLGRMELMTLRPVYYECQQCARDYAEQAIWQRNGYDVCNEHARNEQPDCKFCNMAAETTALDNPICEQCLRQALRSLQE